LFLSGSAVRSILGTVYHNMSNSAPYRSHAFWIMSGGIIDLVLQLART